MRVQRLVRVGHRWRRRLAGPRWAVTGLIGLGLGGLFFWGCATPGGGASLPKSANPVTPTTNQVDDYLGVKVVDPYRWLEDENAPATKAWIAAENKATFAYLDAIPQREQIRQRLTALWNYARYSPPHKEGGRYFYERNDGLQNQSVICALGSLRATPRVILDPNPLSSDGTVALSGYAVSPDGHYLAYGLATAGSDWQEWKVRVVSTRRDLADDLKWIKFSGVSWTRDDAGFYYSRYAAPAAGQRLTKANYFQKLYYHRLGSPQLADRLVYERPDHKDWGFNGKVTDDGHYLIITVSRGTDPRNGIFYQDLRRPHAPVVELLRDFDASYQFIDNDGPVFWFQTDLGAPRGRVIAINVNQPGRTHWREIIPQATATLQRVSVVDHQFIACYLKDAHAQVKVFNLARHEMRTVALPGLGTVRGFRGHQSDRDTFYSYTSFCQPPVIYHYDLKTGKSTVFRRPAVKFNPADYETHQVFYHSKDGTRVPMFITYKKGLRLNGHNPTLLYGYGGFNISLTPSFSVPNLVWMEMGGVYAMANLRGGGEYGEAWHLAGTKLHRQNVFDDFIAAAEWLIAHRYTSRHELAISGASNGGLLVGACMTQRPDLFGACLPAVGVMDMLRFQKFTIGWAWTSDYGSSDNPQQFKALYAYSPYHNLRPGVHYPPTLITTADHDDRVVPAHSFKFAARLQACQAGRNPVLIRIETRAGHGAGKPTTKRIAEATDQLAFLVHVLGMKLPKF